MSPPDRTGMECSSSRSCTLRSPGGLPLRLDSRLPVRPWRSHVRRACLHVRSWELPREFLSWWWTDRHAHPMERPSLHAAWRIALETQQILVGMRPSSIGTGSRERERSEATFRTRFASGLSDQASLSPFLDRPSVFIEKRPPMGKAPDPFPDCPGSLSHLFEGGKEGPDGRNRRSNPKAKTTKPRTRRALRGGRWRTRCETCRDG